MKLAPTGIDFKVKKKNRKKYKKPATWWMVEKSNVRYNQHGKITGIKPVEVLRVTERMLRLPDWSLVFQEADYYKCFPTLNEAKEWAEFWIKRDIAQYRSYIKERIKKLNEIREYDEISESEKICRCF